MKKILILLFLGISVMGSEKPNIVFIYTDDHGYADIGCQSVVDDVKTPFIDELARGGARMTSGYSSAPQCCPSRAGLMTGRYQTRFNFEGNADCPLPLSETTIASYLKKVGYETFHVGKWHLDANRQSTRFALSKSGLDLSKMTETEIRQAGTKLSAKDVSKIVRKHNSPYRPDKRGFKVSINSNNIPNKYHLEVNNEEAVKFIDENHENPFFLYIAHRAPHVPLTVTDKYLKRFPEEMPERRRKALAMISCMDDGVGMLLETLRKYNIEEKTLIFFMSDNGAPYKKTKKDSPGDGPGWDGSLNNPWTGEKGTLLEGGIRLPYLVYWKGKISPQVYSEPVITLDATATALELAGVKPLKPLDGINLIPLLNGEKKKVADRDLFWRWMGQMSIRSGKWKYVELSGSQESFLFDVTSTEHEHKNLLQSHPEIAQKMKKKLDSWLSVQNPPGLNRTASSQGLSYFEFFLNMKFK